MSYSSIYQSRYDQALIGRVTAARAQEGAADPLAGADQAMWAVVVAADVEAAYESAVIAGNPDPGGDPAVITDAMILAKVQALP